MGLLRNWTELRAFDAKNKAIHEAALATPFRLIESYPNEYIVQWYIKKYSGYEWHHPRGSIQFDGKTPGYGFFCRKDISKGDTRDSMREAVRYFKMVWQYVYAEEAAELLEEGDEAVVLLHKWNSIDAMFLEFDV